MTASLKGKIVADKGYISKELFDSLWKSGLYLFICIRRNRRNYLMPLNDKPLLGKRFIVETLFDKLKTEMGLGRPRHCLVSNAIVHILSCLAAYTLGKPSIETADVA